MSYFNIVAETNENTVVTEYTPVRGGSEGYQSEAKLEREFIKDLCEQGYEYLNIHSEEDLVKNLRKRLEKLNNYHFSDEEWERFFKDVIAKDGDGIKEKTEKIQEGYLQVLRCDDGLSKNIRLIDKENIHNNSLQVINQYVVRRDDGARHDNRYDVTVLVNGLPMVHIELKRRGVAIREAFNQIERYLRDSFWAGSGLFEYVQIFVISNGTETKYYSNSTRFNVTREGASRKNRTSNNFVFTSFWSDANNRIIPDLVDFTRTFFAKHTILNILTKYCIFTTDKILLVMRPYQITATERILTKIVIANNYKKYGSIEGGGYIWHTTGSGKTLTSFKTAILAKNLPFIDKVLFVVDRRDLDYQTMKEYDHFQKGAANGNKSTNVLTQQLGDNNSRIIITTIQKLSCFIRRNPDHAIYGKRVVIIFDECHRSQFGEMHKAIVKRFKKYHIFGFTGTPIFAGNEIGHSTTKQIFGDELHTYTILNAINDKNVLPFRVDYVRTMNKDVDIVDEQVYDIDRRKLYEAPERISLVTKYILEHFDQKTYRNDKSYHLNRLCNVSEVASAEDGKVKEERVEQYITGFNSIFAVQSVSMAKLYYDEFKRQMEENPQLKLRVGIIFTCNANEEEPEEEDEKDPVVDKSSRDFMDRAIGDYNKLFNTNYSTDGELFLNYYRDISLRMKNKELDLLIVVNMFLTGFDATTLNTLWVDKNLREHGLIQAFSRTNRILNSIKTFGNIVCFRNLQEAVDTAIARFGDKDAGGIVLMKRFEDYYKGFEADNGKWMAGYEGMISELREKFPLSEPRIVGEEQERRFISLFGAILRMRNVLSSFDEFTGKEILSERDMQDYLGRYQDLRDEWRRRTPKGEATDVTDDCVFEVELIKQIEINIDYILALIEKYHESNCEDKEILVNIRKAVASSPKLRSKKDLIEEFIAKVNGVEDVTREWHKYIERRREEELRAIIRDENLVDNETRRFLENALRNGEIKTYGTDITKIMPRMKRFGNNENGVNRAEKRRRVIDRLKAFLERFLDIGCSTSLGYTDDEENVLMAAERDSR